MENIEQLQDSLNSLRSRLDAIDDTSLWKLSKLFDAMTKDCDDALKLVEQIKNSNAEADQREYQDAMADTADANRF